MFYVLVKFHVLSCFVRIVCVCVSLLIEVFNCSLKCTCVCVRVQVYVCICTGMSVSVYVRVRVGKINQVFCNHSVLLFTDCTRCNWPSVSRRKHKAQRASPSRTLIIMTVKLISYDIYCLVASRFVAASTDARGSFQHRLSSNACACMCECVIYSYSVYSLIH